MYENNNYYEQWCKAIGELNSARDELKGSEKMRGEVYAQLLSARVSFAEAIERHRQKSIDLSALLEAKSEIVARVVPERNKLDEELRGARGELAKLKFSNYYDHWSAAVAAVAERTRERDSAREQLASVIEQRKSLERRLGLANDEILNRQVSEEKLRDAKQRLVSENLSFQRELGEERGRRQKAEAALQFLPHGMDSVKYGTKLEYDSLGATEGFPKPQYMAGKASPYVSGIRWAPPEPSVIHSSPYFTPDSAPADNNANAAPQKRRITLDGWFLEVNGDDVRFIQKLAAVRP